MIHLKTIISRITCCLQAFLLFLFCLAVTARAILLLGPVLLVQYTRAYRVLVKGFSFHNNETIIFIIDPHYGKLNKIP